MKKLNINSIEHPLRKLAVDILEDLMDYKNKNWKNETWYELEDKLTYLLENRLKEFEKYQVEFDFTEK